ncbi:MAG TPA: amidase family protein [Gemmatimonadaceae bacterium]
MTSAAEIAASVRKKKRSPVEVVEEALARIEKLNPTLNAIVTLNPRALDDARALEKRIKKGEDVGPLAGVPVGIKDVTQVKGLRTTFGSPLFADHVPEVDALVVERFRNAGAIIIGKTNTPEFAAGGNTWNDVFGRTRNPWNPSKSAGGSTGGGAVGLATGMIAIAEGTDLGGSLRIPASFCGIVGLRPSPGLVPTDPAEWVWDTLQVSGPMARSAGDVALALQAIAGPSDRSPIAQPAEGRNFVAAVKKGPKKKLKIAYCPDIAGIGIESSIEAVCRKAAFDLRQMGAKVDEIAFDLSYARDAFLALRGEWFLAWMYEKLDRLEQLGVNVRNNTKSGLEARPLDVGAAHHARGRVWKQFRELFEKYDHLLTPTMCVSPFPVDQNYPETVAGKKMKTYVDWLAPTFLLSMSGLPVASVPVGLDDARMPVGMQIVGRPRGEEEVLALAGVFPSIGQPQV